MYRIRVVGCPLILLSAILVMSNCARSKSEKPAQPVSNAPGEELSEAAVTQLKNDEVQSGKVTVSYSLAKSQFSLHEPVILKFAAHNGLAEPVKLDLGEGDLRFTVTQPAGSSMPMRRTRIDSISGWGITSLNAGQTYNHDVVLNE